MPRSEWSGPPHHSPTHLQWHCKLPGSLGRLGRAAAQGHVQTLLAVDDMLFSGSNDQATTIHLWKLDASGAYQPQVLL